MVTPQIRPENLMVMSHTFCHFWMIRQEEILNTAHTDCIILGKARFYLEGTFHIQK